MQVVCIKPFGNAEPGDVAEVPDGASVDPEHWRPRDAPQTPPEPSQPAVPAVFPSPVTPAEM